MVVFTTWSTTRPTTRSTIRNMNKQSIRAQVLKERNELSGSVVAEKSEAIMTQLEAREVFQKAERILFYYSHHQEVHTIDLFKKWIRQKKLYLPKLLDSEQMEAVWCPDLEEIQLNQFSIPEPKGKEVAEGLDLILVPGVAFDLKGNRIGMGKGYYDRFLARYPDVFKIGLAFEFQIFDELPKDPYDVAVDRIITEKRIINCNLD